MVFNIFGNCPFNRITAIHINCKGHYIIITEVIPYVKHFQSVLKDSFIHYAAFFVISNARICFLYYEICIGQQEEGGSKAVNQL